MAVKNSTINRGLNGLNPLSYMGDNPTTPPDFYSVDRDPGINDTEYYLCDLWLNTSTKRAFVLVSLNNNQSTWVPFTGSGGLGPVITLTGNSGGAIPALAGNINVVGDNIGITAVGNPATNTITFSLTGPGTAAIEGLRADDGLVALPLTGVVNIHNTDTNIVTTAATANTVTLNLAPNITVTGSGAVITLSSSTATLATNPEIVFGSSGNHISFFQNEVYIGQSAGNNTGTGLFNVAIGPFAGNSLNSASANICIGNAALQNCSSGGQNVMLGYVAGIQITTGNNNVGLGAATYSGGGGLGLVTGSGNIAIGSNAGSAFRAAETYNIDIGYNVSGTVGDNNTLRIGTGTGAGVGQLNRAFIAGIRGITTGVANAISVLIDSNGQLGTVSSSARYKDNIEDMGEYSSLIMRLRPTTFNYKEHLPTSISVGLIAEEVDKLMPNLVVYKDGEPETVRYNDIPVMLLNEMQKLAKRVEELEAR
jgi:hypothetical protein